jgi:hypothetical protein
MSRRAIIPRVLALGLAGLFALCPVRADQPQPAPARGFRFVVTLPHDLPPESVRDSGRLFVFLSSRDIGEPRRAANWFKPDPFFAQDVADLHPGLRLIIDDSADGFPDKLSKLVPRNYRAQAVLDQSLDHHNPGTAPGNLYSGVITFDAENAQAGELEMVLSERIVETPFPQSQWVHDLKLRSRRLSEFHGRDVYQAAAVVLPRSYFNEPAKRYPVVYSIPGFGGNYRDALAYKNGGPEPSNGETEFIRVFLSGECRWGHHVFANSATNGPRGDAFVYELIPYLDEHYRTVPQPDARFVTGHSSGGWASLWLMVSYPEHLGGAWSTSPDPVDFREFQRIDLYQRQPPVNVFVDPQGNRRPIARHGESPLLWFDSFCKMDDVLKRGGQLRSFEAVFSPRGGDGQPLRLWDRTTGQVDPRIAEAWKAYDIRLKLEQDWDRLRPLLAGKLHIWTGELDTFYLEGAVRLLKSSLAALGSDAEITIVPRRDHATILSADLMATIRRQMSEQFWKYHRR